MLRDPWPQNLVSLPLGQLLWSYLQALPVALALAYLLPAALFIVVAVARSIAGTEAPGPRAVPPATTARRPGRKRRRGR